MPTGGLLFSDYFLRSGVEDLPEWQAQTPTELDQAREVLTKIMDSAASAASMNESDTERLVIEPLLDLLGWTHRLTQQNLSPTGRTDVPDYLLFGSREDFARAQAQGAQNRRYRNGASFLEGKAWQVPLDRAAAGSAPSTQMLRYLSLAEVQSDQRIRFAILTNGRLWRLYDQKARSRAEEFLEVDLLLVARPDLATEPDDANRALRLFLLFFAGSAFRADTHGKTLHERALGESRRYEEQVTKALADVVFGRVFRDLADALRRNDPDAGSDAAYLAELREATLIYLYRLLFTLFAEDRKLLPTWNRQDGLTAMRGDIALHADGRLAFSARRANYDGDLRALWDQIDQGDDSIGLPPYNGGLFRSNRPILERSRIPDAEFAPILDGLSRTELALARKHINYRDLSVQHLGSVYERLLEHELAIDEGALVQRPNAFARKTSGSYYTPEELVLLIIGRTIGPLVDERLAAFHDLPARADAATLTRHDPASAILDLTIVDPAMGSGHFLVSLVDWLADRVLLAVADAEASRDDYTSPLTARLEAIAQHIQSEAEAHGWKLPIGGLEPRHLVRRIILKRVIHGVDKNPMAVELAKLSLWLHTFTVGAPLSFLDHHLRTGDSLFGEWVRGAQDFLDARGAMMASPVIQTAHNAARGMLSIEAMSDADIQEVHDSADRFEGVEQATAPLNAVLSLIQAWRWLGSRDRSENGAFARILDGTEGDMLRIAQGLDEPRTDQARSIIERLRAIGEQENFLHWQVAFPNRWNDWTSAELKGGFDAVIGNPPWGNMEFEELGWLKVHAPTIAHAVDAASRATLLTQAPQIASLIAAARERMSRMMSALRQSESYSYGFGRKIDIGYPFALRCASLIKSDGVVGLLVPTGVVTSQGSASFVQQMLGSRTLNTVLDYQNKPSRDSEPFFEAVDSRYRFCFLSFGGLHRNFGEATCGFLLAQTDGAYLQNRTFKLTHAALSAMSPEQGGLSIITDDRQAGILAKVYAAHPSIKENHSTSHFVYSQMFNTSDRRIDFKSSSELDGEGYYPVEHGLWRRGDDLAVPLIEGKMIDAFDHRFAEVSVDSSRLYRPGQPVQVPLAYKENPDYYLPARYYVDASLRPQSAWRWICCFKDVTGPRNHRTALMSIAPFNAFNHKAPVWYNNSGDPLAAARFAGCFNSFVFDFLVRSKLTSNSLPKFLLEQLPVPSDLQYERRFGSKTAAEIVREDVLALTYTAHDMEPFARDLGYDGLPFAWDEEDRRTRRARLDALYFHLYGIGRDDADYILSTFPIVERHDRAAHGRFLTRDLILAWMNALAAGGARRRDRVASTIIGSKYHFEPDRAPRAPARASPALPRLYPDPHRQSGHQGAPRHMNWMIGRAEALSDPDGARRKALAKLQGLTQLDDPEAAVVPILIDAILLAESYRGARHQITFLPELTRSVDRLLRELDIIERAEALAAES